MHLQPLKSLLRIAALTICGLAVAAAQTTTTPTKDTSGNGLLMGSFSFRHVAVQNVDANLNPTEVSAVSGTITFDGAGKYTLTATSVDNTVSSGAPQSLSLSGTYAIGSNGTGYLTNELYPTDFNALIYGAVAQGVFSGSSTESETGNGIFNDLFIAIPTGSAPTNASFTSTYQTALLDFTGGGSTAIKNALFQLTPDGSGGLGPINLNGQASNQTTPTVAQSVTGGTYNFNSNGSASLTIPLPSGVTSTNALFTGSKTIFESADGNFILGWTAGGYDIFFGVKALTTAVTNSASAGLYFTTAVEDTLVGYGVYSYAGATVATGDINGDAIVHERFNAPGFAPIDYGSDDQIILNSNGTSTPDDFGYEYVWGAGGNAFVAIGSGGSYALQVGLHAPAFSGSGVYLNPIGVVNAASWQPITASLAPGELFVLYGTGLSQTTMSAQGGQAFPTSLGGVSVSINGISCPVYYVAPTQIAAIAPYELASAPTDFANIQVTSNGVQSNIVQMYTTDAAPGAFTVGSNGIGYALAEDAVTGVEITPSNPAQPGEFISLFMTGLGTVTPTVTDGAVGPSSPLSWSDVFNNGNLAVNFNDYGSGGLVGNPGNIQYAGLVPTLAGLYQLNVEVPSIGLVDGDSVYIEFVTDGADVNEVVIPYGSPAPANSDARQATARSKHHARPMRSQRHKSVRRARTVAGTTTSGY
jgi:uncharacterized protein (TIGR03437 family)